MHTVETIIETAGTTPLSDWPVWICLMILLAIEAVYAAELHIPKRRKKDAGAAPIPSGSTLVSVLALDTTGQGPSPCQS